jgi:hypothetical protein
MRKIPKRVRAVVDQHTSLGYAAADIFRAVKAQTPPNEKDLLQHINARVCRNSRMKTYLKNRASRAINACEESDVNTALEWLEQMGYLTQIFVASNTSVGYVFAHPDQLQYIGQNGNIVLMDATHNTTHWDWKLFTVYFRTVAGTCVTVRTDCPAEVSASKL